MVSFASGVVIFTSNYQDQDLIVKMLTNHGWLTFIALGVRKLTSKNRPALQVGNLITVEYFKARLTNKMSKLKKAVITKQFPLDDNHTMLFWMQFCQRLNQVKTYDPSLFRAIVEVYDMIGPEYLDQVKTYLHFHLLTSLGAKQVMNRCVECGRNDNIAGFEFYRGGFTCKNHTKNPRPLKLLRSFLALGQNFTIFKTTTPDYIYIINQELTSYINLNLAKID